MGVIRDIWNKTSFARNAEEAKKQKEFEDQLRLEVREESKDELKKIVKDKILEEEKAKVLGVNKSNKAKNILAQIGEEFKQSNIGSNEKMDRLLGKQTGSNVQDKGNLIGGNNFMNADKMKELIGGIKGKEFRDDYSKVIGLGKRGKNK